MRGTNGSDRVSCGSISTEVKVTASGAPVTWLAQARDRHPGSRRPYEGTVLSGVSVDPSAGTLDSGQSVVLRVRGSFDGGTELYVVVEANDSPSSLQAVSLKCR